MEDATQGDATAAVAVLVPDQSVLARLKDALGVAVIVFGAAYLGICFSVLGPLVPNLRDYFNQTPGTDGAFLAQMVAVSPALGIVLGGPLMGWLVGRQGPRFVLFLTLAIFAIAGSSGVIATDAWIWIVMRVLQGASSAGIAVATTTMVGERFGRDGRGRILGFQMACASLGSFLALLLSGRIAGEIGWRYSFAINLFALVVLAVAVIAIPPAPTRGAHHGTTEPVASMWVLLVRFWPFYVMVAGLSFIASMSAAQIPLLLGDVGIASPETRSYVLGASHVMLGTAGFCYGFVRPRLPVSIFVVILGCIGAGMLIISQAHGDLAPYIAGLGCGLVGIGGGNLYPHQSNMIIERSTEDQRGRVIALMLTVQFVAEFINPLIVRPMHAYLPLSGVLMVVGSAVAVAAVIVALRGRPAR